MVICLKIIVDVKAESREERIEKIGDNKYLIYVKAARNKGKANIAVLKLLKKHFGKNAKILNGHMSTRKIVEIEV